MKKRKQVPRLENESAERVFWETHDSTEYVDWRKGKFVAFPGLKPRGKTISLRLPEPMLAALKVLANKRDVPYQSLMKMFLADRISTELRSARRTGNRTA